MPNTDLFAPPSDNLKGIILDLNNAYRAGQPKVSDEQYDTHLDMYRATVAPEEYASFLRLLTEPGGEVKHPYTVGSLKKIKYGENQLNAWLLKQANGSMLTGYRLLVMAKIDGLAFVASYIDGFLAAGATRGDGIFGKSISEKLCHILPLKLNQPVTLDVRGELTLTGNDHAELGFKNKRNGSVGIINRDNPAIEEVSKIKGFAYQIKAGYMAHAPVYDQLKLLKALGFNTPSWSLVDVPPSVVDKLEGNFATLMERWKITVPYDLDGLVICCKDYCLEDTFLPDGMVSFKINQDAVQTTVSGIEWNISKNGLCKPVVLIKPVKIDGTTVSRVTGYNAQWLLDNGIGAGALVGVIKSGEIIPKITEVYQIAPVVLLDECPSCCSLLHKEGVDLVCNSESCGAAGVKEVESFLIKLDVDGAKATTLENWGIRSLDDLLAWTPDSQYKSQTNLYSDLSAKIFNAPADRLFAAMLFDGFGRKSIGKLIEYYGSRLEATSAVRRVAECLDVTLPEGFGVTSMSKAAPSWERNLEMLGKVCADPRYTEPAPEEKSATGGKLGGMSFLFTGTLSMPRKQAEKLVTDNGGTISGSVSKNLTYLVAGESAGSKLDRANKLGVAVLSEQEFKAMV